MKISVVIPARNEAERIAETVGDALAARPHEVLVVDGESDDGTAEIARRAGGRVVVSPPGRALQQNRGAEQATGDVLLFLHADSGLPADGLDQIATALQNPRISGGAFRQQIDAAASIYRLIERGNALRVRWLKTAYGDQGIFLRRTVFESLGGFPTVKLMEDLLLMRQLKRAGHRLVLLPGPLRTSARRWQEHGVVRQTLRNWTFVAAERLGVSPDRLAEFYRPHWQTGGGRAIR